MIKRLEKELTFSFCRGKVGTLKKTRQGAVLMMNMKTTFVKNNSSAQPAFILIMKP